jgi:hypothetical protein
MRNEQLDFDWSNVEGDSRDVAVPLSRVISGQLLVAVGRTSGGPPEPQEPAV